MFGGFCRPYIDGYNGPAQQAQYSGHKKCHGNNHQGCTTPDGILVEMHGPYSGRTNDIKMLTRSSLLDRLMHAGVYRGISYCAFGDRGYPRGNPWLHVPFSGRHLPPPQAQYNLCMSRVRQCVEWSFGKVGILYAFVDFDKNQKLYLQPVASYWQVAALLANCHSCLYGNETAQYFGLPTPELEVYMAGAFRP